MNRIDGLKVKGVCKNKIKEISNVICLTNWQCCATFWQFGYFLTIWLVFDNLATFWKFGYFSKLLPKMRYPHYTCIFHRFSRSNATLSIHSTFQNVSQIIYQSSPEFEPGSLGLKAASLQLCYTSLTSLKMLGIALGSIVLLSKIILALGSSLSWLGWEGVGMEFNYLEIIVIHEIIKQRL